MNWSTENLTVLTKGGGRRQRLLERGLVLIRDAACLCRRVESAQTPSHNTKRDRIDRKRTDQSCRHTAKETTNSFIAIDLHNAIANPVVNTRSAQTVHLAENQVIMKVMNLKSVSQLNEFT